MKKYFVYLSAVLLILSGIISFPLRIHAEDSFEYEILKNGTVSITSYKGGDDLVIPETIDGYTVSAIAKKAFENDSFKNVTIPKSVVLIEERAFFHSEIEKSLSFLGPVSIGKDAFKNAELPDNLVIPAGSEISEEAFAYTNDLEDLLIGENVVVKEEAFYHSEDLETIGIMADTSVGKGSFRECSEITELHIADNCRISGEAFEDNTLLKEAHIADTAKIDKNAFAGMKLRIDNKVAISSSLDKNKVAKEKSASAQKSSSDVESKAKTDDAGQQDSFAFSDYALILNKNTHKFHQNTCDSVYDIAPKNREGFNGTPEEAMKLGYEPCKKCSAAWAAPEATPAPVPQVRAAVSAGQQYIINTNTGKFHYPSCRSVRQMKDKNKLVYNGTREEIISMGYDPCQNCNP